MHRRERFFLEVPWTFDVKDWPWKLWQTTEIHWHHWHGEDVQGHESNIIKWHFRYDCISNFPNVGRNLADSWISKPAGNSVVGYICRLSSQNPYKQCLSLNSYALKSRWFAENYFWLMYTCISVFGPELWTGIKFNDDVTVWRQHLFWILDFDTFGFYQQIKLRNGSANSQAVLLQSLMARVWRYQDGSSKTGMQNGCCQWKRTAIWPCCIGHRIRVWSTYLHLAVFMLTVNNSFTPDMDPIKVFSSDATIWVFCLPAVHLYKHHHPSIDFSGSCETYSLRLRLNSSRTWQMKIALHQVTKHRKICL